MQITPASAPLKLPVDSATKLLSGLYQLQIYPDGSLHQSAAAASLAAMKTHVTSQFIQGSSVSGYVRVTLDSTGILAGVTLATLVLPIASVWFANVLINSILTAEPKYYDSIAVGGRIPVYPIAQITTDPDSQSFDLVSNSNAAGSQSYAFLYHVSV